jgi:hypothetical protein
MRAARHPGSAWTFAGQFPSQGVDHVEMEAGEVAVSRDDVVQRAREDSNL